MIVQLCHCVYPILALQSAGGSEEDCCTLDPPGEPDAEHLEMLTEEA